MESIRGLGGGGGEGWTDGGWIEKSGAPDVEVGSETCLMAFEIFKAAALRGSGQQDRRTPHLVAGVGVDGARAFHRFGQAAADRAEGEGRDIALWS